MNYFELKFSLWRVLFTAGCAGHGAFPGTFPPVPYRVPESGVAADLALIGSFEFPNPSTRSEKNKNLDGRKTPISLAAA